MSRTEKLFQRLDELEAEYRDLTAHEIRKWIQNHSHHKWVLFQPERLPQWLKYFSLIEKEILWIEKEIRILRRKLGQPMMESPVHWAHDAAARIYSARWSGEATEPMIAKTLLKKLGHEELIPHP